MDVALANPELIIVTRDGDRFASSGWRIASVVRSSPVRRSKSRSRPLARRPPLSRRCVSAERARTPSPSTPVSY